MLKVKVEKIGDVAVIHCEGRVVQSAAAFQLRDTVIQQKNARIVLLDFSGVRSLQGGGLGMLVFLQRWAGERGIQFKIFDPPAAVRQRLKQARWASGLEITASTEVLALLFWEVKELREGFSKVGAMLSATTDTL